MARSVMNKLLDPRSESGILFDLRTFSFFSGQNRLTDERNGRILAQTLIQSSATR